MSRITQILSQAEGRDTLASSQLLPLVYDELRRLAAARLNRETPGQTLQPTALVHEAYLRLVDSDEVQGWNDRGHFFGAAAEAMRRILVERARHKASTKGGGGHTRVEMADKEVTAETPAIDLIALDDALSKLQSLDPRKAALVKLRYFVGMTSQDAASALGISPTTADNDWAYAKCWLRLEISGETQQNPLPHGATETAPAFQ